MTRFAPVPSYKDLFGGDIPKLEELLRDIPSVLVLELLGLINAELHLSTDTQESARQILALLLHRHPESQIKTWFDEINPVHPLTGQRKFSLFSTLHTLDFIHYELTHYRDFEFDDTTAEQEIRILKSYFLIIENRNENDAKIYDLNKDELGDFYHTHTWPMLIGQMEASNKVNPVTEAARGIVLFNYLEFHSDYGKYVKDFLEKRGHKSSWNYVLDLLNIIQTSWSKNTQGIFSKARFAISNMKGYEDLFESFTINPEDYSSKFWENHKNYSGLKEKPLLKIDENTFIVLNWHFLSGKLYEGLIFDFYYKSDISQKIDSFLNFKKMIGGEITEDFLFKRLLTTILKKKHSILQFDQGKNDGHPDCYYRFGNKIILFEIKDAYFPSGAVMSGSYQEIKAAIDLKYNSKKKGVIQLSKQMKQLLDKSFEKLPGYKHARNLCIYPVLIYSDAMFSMPGINNYLQSELDNKIQTDKLNGKFKQIKPLSFIDIRFLINHVHVFGKKGFDLMSLFDTYHKIIERTKKKAERDPDLDNFFDSYPMFSVDVPKELGKMFEIKENFVRLLFDTLDLTKGLPDSTNQPK